MGLCPGGDEAARRAERLGFRRIPFRGLWLFMLQTAVAMGFSTTLVAFTELTSLLAGTLLLPVVAVVTTNVRPGETFAALWPTLWAVGFAGLCGWLLRLLDLTGLTCALFVPGTVVSFDPVTLIGVFVLQYAIVFSEQGPLFDRLGSASMMLLVLSRSVALGPTCSAGWDELVEYVVIGNLRYLGGLLLTVSLGLVCALLATTLFAWTWSAHEANIRVERVLQRLGHAAHLTIQAYFRMRLDASEGKPLSGPVSASAGPTASEDAVDAESVEPVLPDTVTNGTSVAEEARALRPPGASHRESSSGMVSDEGGTPVVKIPSSGEASVVVPVVRRLRRAMSDSGVRVADTAPLLLRDAEQPPGTFVVAAMANPHRAPTVEASARAVLDSAEVELATLRFVARQAWVEAWCTTAAYRCCCRGKPRSVAHAEILEVVIDLIVRKLRIVRMLLAAEEAVPSDAAQAKISEVLRPSVVDSFQVLDSALFLCAQATFSPPSAPDDSAREKLLELSGELDDKANEVVHAFTLARREVLYGTKPDVVSSSSSSLGGDRAQWSIVEILPTSTVVFSVLRLLQVAAITCRFHAGIQPDALVVSGSVLRPAPDQVSHRETTAMVALHVHNDHNWCCNLAHWCFLGICCGFSCCGVLPNRVKRSGAVSWCSGTPKVVSGKRAFQVALTVAIASLFVFAKPLVLSEGTSRIEWSVWTPLAVAFVFMNASGGTTRQSALRLQGTVVGSIVALLITVVSAQHIVWVRVLLSLWAGLASIVRHSFPKFSYAGSVAMFTAAIIALGQRPDGVSVADVVLSRVLQNTIGVCLFLIVSNLVFPIFSSVGTLQDISRVVDESGRAMKLISASVTRAASRRFSPTDDEQHVAFARQALLQSNQVETVALGLASKLSDSRAELGVPPTTRAAFKCLIIERELWKLVRCVRAMNQCRITLAQQAGENALPTGRSVDDVASSSHDAFRELLVLGEPIQQVGDAVRRLCAATSGVLTALARSEQEHRDPIAVPGRMCRRRDQALLRSAMALDRACPMAISKVLALDSKFHQTVVRLLELRAAGGGTALPLSTTDVVAFHSAVFCARDAAWSALAIAARVSEAASHMLPRNEPLVFDEFERWRFKDN
jgi:hypothetical protein